MGHADAEPGARPRFEPPDVSLETRHPVIAHLREVRRERQVLRPTPMDGVPHRGGLAKVIGPGPARRLRRLDEEHPGEAALGEAGGGRVVKQRLPLGLELARGPRPPCPEVKIVQGKEGDPVDGRRRAVLDLDEQHEGRAIQPPGRVHVLGDGQAKMALHQADDGRAALDPAGVRDIGRGVEIDGHLFEPGLLTLGPQPHQDVVEEIPRQDRLGRAVDPHLIARPVQARLLGGIEMLAEMVQGRLTIPGDEVHHHGAPAVGGHQGGPGARRCDLGHEGREAQGEARRHQDEGQKTTVHGRPPSDRREKVQVSPRAGGGGVP